MTRLINALRQLVERGTCHHCLYGVLALLYIAAEMGLCDKGLVSQGSMAVYLALALRP